MDHELVLEAEFGVDEDDSRWVGQKAALIRDLQDICDRVRQSNESQAGTKGMVAEIILALSSAGAFKALFDYLRVRAEQPDHEFTLRDASGSTQSVSSRGLTTEQFLAQLEKRWSQGKAEEETAPSAEAAAAESDTAIEIPDPVTPSFEALERRQAEEE